MYAYDHGTANHSHAVHTHQGCAGYAPTPGYAATATALAAGPVPVPSPPIVALSSRTPSPMVLAPVAVPPGCYPIELVQFWRDEHARGQPCPLHWALFVRTAPRAVAVAAAATATATTARGNMYELAGTPDTYTAQSLQGVVFEPDGLPDWRGTHVIGWVSPTQLAVFEGLVRQVPVWRHRADWRSQHWVYEVVRAVGGGNRHQGVFMDGVTFGVLQKHMGKLWEAWERGDI